MSNRENFVSYRQLKELYLFHEKIKKKEELNNKSIEEKEKND